MSAATMKHLHRNGSYKAAKPVGRLYTVRALFPNVNADYDFVVCAANKGNALWVAAAALRGTGATVGEIKSARS